MQGLPLWPFPRLFGPIVVTLTLVLWYLYARLRRSLRQLRHFDALVARSTGPAARPLPRRLAWDRGIGSGIFLAAFYLLLFRGISFLPWFKADHNGGAILMSFSFLFLGPFAAGYLTVTQAPSRKPWRVREWILMPWIPVFLNIILALSFLWEGIICVVFILPPAMISASLGGVLAGWTQRYRHRQSSRATMLCLAVAPLLLAMVETRLNQPLQTRTVETAIVIHAPAAVIWHNIERVPAIAPSELRGTWANAIGFPRPIEATLSHEGVGGVRNASFERGLNFIETVTAWEPDHRIAFSIKADTAHIPPTTLDEHVTIGGRFFDVLEGEYNLETRPSGDILLHLTSHQRLSTDFNLYAAMWSDAVMRDVQNNILHVVQHRCETAAASIH